METEKDTVEVIESNVTVEATQTVNVSSQEYKYDAFISYRHVEPDASIAAALHKKLENYKFPENVKAVLGNGHEKIERVFRDEEELPIASSLEDAIVTALRNSEWLIVICSPRLIESQWCRLEIKNFIEMHGRDHVLAVLVEGEPDTAFPDELLYENVTTVDNMGIPHVEKKRVEPLAADVRGENTREMIKKLEGQKLKLIAAMFGINYDALKQRHKANEARRKFRISMAITAAALIVGVYSTVVMLQLDKQNKRIIRQNERIEEQNNQLLSSQAINTAERSVLYCDADDRQTALRLAYESCTSIDDINMPYTPEGEYAITNALNVYGPIGSYDSYAQLTVPGRVKRAEFSPDYTFYAVLDDVGNLYVWRAENLQKVAEISGVQDEADHNTYSFVFATDNQLMFITDEGLSLLNLNTSSRSIVSSDSHMSLAVNSDRTKVVALACTDSYSTVGTEYIVVYDTSTFNTVASLSNDVLKSAIPSVGSDTIDNIVSFGIRKAWINDNYLLYELGCSGYDYSYVRVINLDHPGVINQYRVQGDSVARAFVNNNNLFVVTNLTDDITNIRVNAFSISLTTGLTNWTYDESALANKVQYFNLEDKLYITITSYGGYYIIDGTNGEEVGVLAGEGQALRTYILDTGILVLTSRNFKSYLPLENDAFENSYSSYLTTSNSSEFIAADLYNGLHSMVFAGKTNSNIIYVFREVSCPGLSPLTSATNARGESNYEGGEYMDELSCEFMFTTASRFNDILDDYSIEDVSTVSSIVYDEDAEVLIVNRSNSTFEIYTSDGRIGEDVVYSFSRGLTASVYYGTDNDGNYYIGTDFAIETYRITPDGSILSCINDMVGLDSENNSIVRVMDGVCMSQPIFSFGELLNKAEEYLAEYDG